MRTSLIAAIALLSASSAAAQSLERPTAPAPRASASVELRDAWCQTYAAWYVAQIPNEAPLPPDVRPDHLLEVELNYCRLDPQRYETQTIAELNRMNRLS
jgi:hypothetical protein